MLSLGLRPGEAQGGRVTLRIIRAFLEELHHLECSALTVYTGMGVAGIPVNFPDSRSRRNDGFQG